MDTSDRSYLNFEKKARKAFTFLNDLGFSEVEASPTLIRYRKGSIEVDAYHGRQSYEIGAGITAFGTRYPISAIIHVTDPEAFKCFRYVMTTTPEGVTAGLKELGLLLKRYGLTALEGDPQFFLALEKQQKLWIEEYTLDVLTRQLQPQADEAFRQKDYSTAAKLYSRIRERLSPAGLKKLYLSEKYNKG